MKFLPDHPSESDFFGSHGRVADAVADVVRDSESINVIGLLGGWGSGKSTVVRHIAKSLETKPGKIKPHLFTYDAWLHQNDPPRRAFLEALIGNLTAQELVKKDDWEPRLADLTGRAEETETETTRRLSDTGKWIFLSLALVPLGLGFLDYELVSKAFGPLANVADCVMFWLSLTFTLAPVLVVTGFYIWWRPWKKAFGRDRWKFPFRRTIWLEHDEAHEEQSILALLTNQSVERSQNKTKISPDPTAIEFRAVFRDVLTALHGHKRRLVIVIDNLDRLAEADAMQLWATIRSLFLGGEASIQAESGLPPPAIILPIDESAISRMFSIAHPKEKDALAAAFVDKTFDIAFHVNEPVMSDWRAFLAEKLQEAFGQLATPERIYWTTKFTEEKLAADAKDEQSEKTRITPRKLIKLVNSIAALFVQRSENDIDFITMAFYAAHRVAIALDVRKFVDDEWPGMDAAVSDWRRELVALHFGVTPEKAFQALLHEPLRLAITSNDHDGFQDLIKGAGAWAVMEEIVNNPPSDAESAGPDANFVANAALLIAAAPSTDEIRSKLALTRLSTHWAEATEIGVMRPDLQEVIATLGATRASDTVAPFLTETARKLGAVMSESRVDETTATALRDSIIALKTLADTHNIDMPAVLLSVGASALFGLLPLLPAEHRRHIRSDKSAGEIVAALNQGLGNENGSSAIPGAVLALNSRPTIQLKDKSKLDWDSVVNTAAGIVQGQALDHHATSAALDVLGILHARNQAAKDRLAENFDQGRLTTLLNEADQQGDPDLLADIATLMLLRGSDFTGPNGKSWEQILKEQDEFLGKVDAALDWYHPAQKATFALQTIKTRPAFRPVARELAKLNVTKHGSGDLTTSYVLSNPDSLETDIGEELLERCLTAISMRDDFWTTLRAIEDGPAFENAVWRLSQIKVIDRDQLLEAIRTRLESTDQIAWESAITNGASPFVLAEIFQSDFDQKELTSDNLNLALNESRSALLQMDTGARERWFTLVGLAPKSARTTSLRSLRDSLLAGTVVADLAGLIIAGGERLMRDGKFAGEADKTGRHVVRPLIGHEEGRAALLSQKAFFAKIVEKSEKDTQTEIADALLSIEEAEQTAQGVQVKELKAAFGLDGTGQDD